MSVVGYFATREEEPDNKIRVDVGRSKAGLGWIRVFGLGVLFVRRSASFGFARRLCEVYFSFVVLRFFWCIVHRPVCCFE